MNPHKKGILCLLILAFSLLQVLSSCTNMISVNFALFTNTPLAFPLFSHALCFFGSGKQNKRNACSQLFIVLMVGAQAVQVKNSIHFSSSLLRITLHKFQQIWWKFTMNPSKVKRQSHNMISKCFIQYRCVEISQLVSPDIHRSNFQNLSFSH